MVGVISRYLLKEEVQQFKDMFNGDRVRVISSKEKCCGMNFNVMIVVDNALYDELKMYLLPLIKQNNTRILKLLR